MKVRGGKWTKPKWMTPAHAMNCDAKDCNLVTNAPRAALCIAVQSQVSLLMKLHAFGLLK
jgi:hypothetical protein